MRIAQTDDKTYQERVVTLNFELDKLTKDREKMIDKTWSTLEKGQDKI